MGLRGLAYWIPLLKSLGGSSLDEDIGEEITKWLKKTATTYLSGNMGLWSEKNS
jgi:hypothetical protein